jgi:D-methionine transport system substrate-binding protein
VLQKAGLLKLKNGGNTLATPADIDASASKVTVIPVDAAQTAPALSSADGAIINNNYALTAGIDPKSALFQDDPKSSTAEPYINAFVARAKDKDNKTYLKIAELYHTKAVTDAVLAESKNTAVIVTRPESDLIGILDGLKKTIQAAQ